MAKKTKLTTRQVRSILQSQKTDSLSSAGGTSKLKEDRATNLDYCLGKMSDIPNAPGRSKVISTDVSDVLDGLMPSMMEIFCGTETVAKFDPVGADDVDASEQETTVINNVVMQKNPGFAIIQAMCKDALLSKTGVTKVWWEEREDEEEDTYFDLDVDSLAILVSNPEMEVVAHTANDDGTHNVTLMKKKGYGCVKIMNVPPEEFGVARRTVRLQETPYCFHEPGGGRPEGELIAEGYDPAQLGKIGTLSAGKTRGTEAIARDTIEENASQGEAGIETPGMRPIRITEHYIIMDYEGTGKATRYQVITGGEESEVLLKNGKPAIEKHSYVPFAVAHPDPMPHRFFGRCPADKTIETQRVKTVLTRGVLDNIYQINNQQVEVNEAFASENTIDDLLNKQIGGIVRTKAAGAVNPIQVLPIADKIFPALEYFDREREWRTGVTREGQGLDAEALQNQSATAARQLHSAAQAKMKLIARNLAEGVRDLFWLVHCVLRKHGNKPMTVRINGSFIPVNPRLWKDRDDMTIMVGLGDGGKQEQLGGLQLLIEAQMQAAMNPALKLITPKNLFNSAKDMVKLLGKRDATVYFSDPGDIPFPDPPPPPEIQKAQIEGQIETQHMQMKAGIEQVQAQADIATNDKKVQADIEMNRERHAPEMQLKQQEHAMRMEEMRMKLIGVAAGAAAKATVGGGGEGEPKPPQPNMEVINHIMAHAHGGVQPAQPKTKRMKRVGPGEWIVEHA